jgi:hypothetical protein
MSDEKEVRLTCGSGLKACLRRGRLRARWDAAAERYLGLKVRLPPATVDNTTLIVRPAIAQAQLDKESAERDAEGGSGAPPGPGDQRLAPDSTTQPAGATTTAPPPPRLITTYVAAAKLDATRVGRGAGKIQHLSVLPATEVDIRLEIHIPVPGGIGDRVVRVVSENAHALGLAASNFEKD